MLSRTGPPDQSGRAGRYAGVDERASGALNGWVGSDPPTHPILASVTI